MTDRKPRAGRSLSEEERALWREFARSIKRLGRSARAVPQESSAKTESPVARRSEPAPTPPRKAERPPALAPIERRARQKLGRGRESIDARIDLHGMTQAQAHAALLRFLHASQGRGARFVLVITGKGGEGGKGGERGVLRRQVPLWLGLPECRDLVVGFDSAAISHGGDGALYVQLRRGR